VRAVAVAKVEGTSPRPGVIWSTQDAGDAKDNCGREGSVLLGTGARGDDNGMLGITARYCGSTVSQFGGA
jgi:hypothetical protein